MLFVKLPVNFSARVKRLALPAQTICQIFGERFGAPLQFVF
jgi:hypothetical protein